MLMRARYILAVIFFLFFISVSVPEEYQDIPAGVQRPFWFEGE